MKVAVLVLASVIVSVVLCEVALRVLGITYPVFHGFDAARGRALEPGKEGWFRGEGEAYVRINSAGFRDVEHEREKPAETYRILILGDSYTEAKQVDLEDTFTRKTEQRLRACPRFDTTPVEVINMGVAGYGNAEQLVTLRSLGWGYSPDLVVTLFFSGNDLLDNYPAASPEGDAFIPRPYFYRDGDVLRLAYNFQESDWAIVKYRLLLWGVHNFRVLEVANRAKRIYSAWRKGVDRENAFRETGLSEFVFAPPTTDVQHEAWALTEDILRLTHREVREHGAQYLLVTATSPNQIEDSERTAVKQRLNVDTLDYPEQRLRRLGKSAGFPVLNLLYEFQRHADAHDVYLHGFPNTRLGAGHWNEAGHDLAAQMIAEEICSHPALMLTR